MILNEPLLKKYLREFYLEKGESISSFNEANGYAINSQNFVITLSSGRQLFLKIIKDYNKITLTKLKILNECFKKKVKVLEIIKGRRGELYITKENFLLVVFRYYLGAKCQFTSEQIFSAGENLARLNQQLIYFNYIFKRSKLYNDLNVEEIEQIVQSSNRDDNFIQKAFSISQKLLNLYKCINEKLNSKRNSTQLVHMDYHTQNVLFKNREVEVILDFDFVVTAPKLLSIGFACDRFSRDIEEMGLFLEGYRKIDKTLSSELLKLIPFYAKREALHRINYILRRHFFHKDRKWDFELDKQVGILQGIDNECKL